MEVHSIQAPVSWEQGHGNIPSNTTKTSCMGPLYMLQGIKLLYLFGSISGFYLSYQCVYARVADEVIHGSALECGISSCKGNQSTWYYQYTANVQKRSANWQLYLSVITNFPAIVTTVVLGTYADRIGRRWLLVLPICGLVLWCFGYLVVIYWTLSLHYLLLVHFMEGVFGQIPVVFLAGFAYISDVTAKNNDRPLHMTVLE